MSLPARFESNAAFINYPKQAAFGRTLPKNKIYEHSGANTKQIGRASCRERG